MRFRTLLFCSLIGTTLLVGCGEPPEVKRKSIDVAYEAARKLPADQVCENEIAYRDLQRLEKKKRTNYYTEVSASKIKEYSQKCRNLKLAEEATQQRRVQQEKLQARMSKVKDNFHVLGYAPDVPQSEINCRNYVFSDNWGPDTYICSFKRSATDVIEFHSDPYTKIIGKVVRKTLIDNEQMELYREKLLERYGPPTESLYRDRRTKGEQIERWEAAWGEDVELFLGYRTKKGKKMIVFEFEECMVSDECEGYWGEKTLNNQIVATTRVVGEFASLNFSALIANEDPRNKQEPSVDTVDVRDIDM